MPAITVTDLANAKLDVDHIAALATSTAPTATDRMGNVKKTLAGAIAAVDTVAATTAAGQATTAAGQATAAKVAAEAARDAAMATGKVYATTAAGLAATTTTQYFSVPSAESAESLILYLNNAGAAVEQKRYPSASSLPPQHISNADFSVTDEVGNSILAYEDDRLKVLKLQTTTLEVLNPVDSSLPLSHITPYALSIADEQGNALGTLDEQGHFVARSFGYPDGSMVGASGLNASFHASPYSQIDAFATMGQSNAAGDTGVTSPPVSTTQPYNNIMPLMVGGAATAFTPLLANAATGWEWTGLNACNQVSKMILRDSNMSVAQLATQLYAFNSAAGGSGIPYVGNDGSSMGFKANILFGNSEAVRLGKTFNVKAVSFSQGEANNTMTAEDYLAKELQMYEWMNAYCKATTGQSNDIKLLTWQVQENTGPRVAQTIAADRYPHIHVCFPEYCGYFKAGNLGHFDALGMALTSAYYGVAYKRLIVDGMPWEPLRHKAIEVRGRDVRVTFNRRGLVLDTTRFAAQAGNGFFATDNSGAVAVSGVAVSDHGTPTVTFARDFVGPVTFGYGVPMSGAGTAGHYGGNLRDCDGYAETTKISGVDYPLHNWAILFKETL